MLKLRRGVVLAVADPEAPVQRLEVEVAREARPATCDTALLGPCEVGDEVVVNTEARDLGLGSGGVDLVHVNLSRGLAGDGTAGAHVMKLNYSSLQHAVLPVEERAPGDEPGDEPERRAPLARPVGVTLLHGQLPPVAWAFARAAPAGVRLGFVQVLGGALPGAHSDVVRRMRADGLLAGHVTAGACFGGEEEAITTAGALDHGLRVLGWDAAVVGPGPGILGSGSPLGHGGLHALDAAHAALALGAHVVVVARMSEGDPRPRHRGLSHHTRTLLDLVLRDVEVAVPAGADAAPVPERHAVATEDVDVDGYAASGLPTRTMGRSLEEDRLFFAAALAGGTRLGRLVAEARA